MTILPLGFRAQVRTDIHLLDGGRTLAGGTPWRMLRLRPPAQAVAAGEVLAVHDRTSDLIIARLLAAGMADPLPDEASAETGPITVVIPIRDRAGRLHRLLTALGGELPVIVVDDASHDPAAVQKVTRQHGARLVALGTNAGPAGARNAGLAEVTTPWVAFVDSDVVVTASVLHGLARHFADPRVVMAGPRVRGEAQSERPRRFERWDAGGISLDLGETAGLVRPWSPIGWLPGACMVARTEDVRATGGFADGQRVAEDVDLVWRLLEAGRMVRYDPAFTATHDSRATWTGWLGRRAFYGTGGAWLAQRHGSWVAPAVLHPVPALLAAVMVAQRRWSGPVAAMAVVALHHRLRRIMPDTPEGAALARELTTQTVVSTARQTTNLALRHWWPLTAGLAIVSPRTRRLVLAALIWDLADHRTDGLSTFTGRRFDDLAYGTGLWLGALRQRSIRCLLPKILRHAARPD